MAALAHVVVPRHQYWAARTLYFLASLAVGYPALTLGSPDKWVALGVILVFFCVAQWTVWEHEHRIVATLSIGPVVVSNEENRQGFEIIVRLKNHAEYLSFAGGWTVEGVRADGSLSFVCRDLLGESGLQYVRSSSVGPEDTASGALVLPYSKAFPKGLQLKGARFTVSISPRRGRILPDSYMVVDSCHA